MWNGYSRLEDLSIWLYRHRVRSEIIGVPAVLLMISSFIAMLWGAPVIGSCTFVVSLLLVYCAQELLEQWDPFSEDPELSLSREEQEYLWQANNPELLTLGGSR